MLRTMYEKDHNNPENVLNAPEKITLQQGIEAFTINGARTMGTDSITGSLEAGKCADLVVLEEDIFETAPEEYCHTNVFMTISDGKVVYKKED